MQHPVTQFNTKYLSVLHTQVSALNLPNFAGVSFNGENTILEFPDRESPLTVSEINAISSAVETARTEIDRLSPLESRAAAYESEVGSIEQQIDALFKSLSFPAGSEAATMQTKRQAIKDRFPKR